MTTDTTRETLRGAGPVFPLLSRGSWCSGHSDIVLRKAELLTFIS